ncbi:MAG: tail fiber domain-containing protein [Desulfobacterales bacterium]|nr:tail fiber domain-containing protein [Desulfobacterales bacterium]
MRFKKVMTMVLAALVFSTVNGFCDGDGLIVDDNGKVGIGTPLPDWNLHIKKDIGDSGTGSTVIGVDAGGSSNYASLRVIGNGSSPSGIYQPDSAVLTAPQTLANGLSFGNVGGDSTKLRFWTGSGDGTERMRIDASGNIGIGTTSPSALLHLQIPNYSNGRILRLKSNLTWDFGINNYGSGNGQDLGIITESSHTRMIVFDNVGSANVRVGINRSNPSYELDVNGTIRGNNVSPSDARWKTNVTTLENSLDKVSGLRGVRYEWKDAAKGTGEQIGLIAQEVEAVFPEAVATDKEGYKSVAYGKLVSPLIQAVKELKQENDGLKQEVSELKQLVQALIKEKSKS